MQFSHHQCSHLHSHTLLHTHPCLPISGTSILHLSPFSILTLFCIIVNKGVQCMPLNPISALSSCRVISANYHCHSGLSNISTFILYMASFLQWTGPTCLHLSHLLPLDVITMIPFTFLFFLNNFYCDQIE